MSTHATYRLWRLPSTWSSAEIICNAVLWVKATPTGKASALRCFFTSVQLFLSAVIRHRFTSLVFWLFSTSLFQRWARCLAGCLQNLGCMLQKQRTWTDRYNTFHLFWMLDLCHLWPCCICGMCSIIHFRKSRVSMHMGLQLLSGNLDVHAVLQIRFTCDLVTVSGQYWLVTNVEIIYCRLW